MRILLLAAVLLVNILCCSESHGAAASEAIPCRGIVEGFYGHPWSMADRREMLEFCAVQGFNAYLYAPKDDAYHRSLWRESYPLRQRQELQQLNDYAAAHGIDFIFAVSPGLDLHFSGLAAVRDRATLLHKLEEMYVLGLRHFALFFDDIADHNAAAQAELVNYIGTALHKAHPDCAPLLVVPTEYFLQDMQQEGQLNPYTSQMAAKLQAPVTVLFTGLDVCPDGLRAADLDAFRQIYARQQTGVWWNYPVNDYLRQRPALGPVDKMPAHPATKCIFFNPMEHPHLSRLTLATAAAYAASPAAYDSEKAWQKALQEQYGPLAKAMGLFASEHQRLENNWAHIGRADAPELAARYEQLWQTTDLTQRQALAAALWQEEQHRLAAGKQLLQELPREILLELRPFLRTYIKDKRNCCRLLKKIRLSKTATGGELAKLKKLRQEMKTR